MSTPCAGKWDIFCGEDGYGWSEAKKICQTECSEKMRNKCLERCLAFEEHEPVRLGVWGGLTAHERNKIYGRKSS
ncbi:WhiB family transcription factor [Mycobacterium phage Optimus]|uniref:WhiB family transcription factor n=4 Tax=Omegavirus TaxID=1623292 RepID=A0A3S9UB00_9CAUD|nr:WhiB family transcriptional regulator [Mycobacterium phage Wanda]YP_009018124.1 WhiB family transcriptional regulator [Mycobacterium phage Thibault]YP_009124083.1 WhiB family transcriptional regulator [Mycobacterium phage Minerva]YP_009590978.1 WhiB family transcriptional regulator [Mycobacterium phage Optimus]YP_009636302.1 WhiB family transcriptional regulator [Mycobacterium phage Baka]ATN88938.1 WhiB family transcription factor [Mycobacterium phage DmpstrDiver]ATN89841.1 WhiB family tra